MQDIWVKEIVDEDDERIMFGGVRQSDGQQVTFAVNGKNAYTVADAVRRAATDPTAPAVVIEIP